MVDQDAPLVVDDQELEPARQHRLAVGEHHLPAECHDVAAEAGGPGGAKANAVPRRALFSGDPRTVSLRQRARIPAALRVWPQGVGRPQRGDGGKRLAASGSFHAAT